WLKPRSRTTHRARPRRGSPLDGIRDWLLEDRCLPSAPGAGVTDPEVPGNSNNKLGQIFWNGGEALNSEGVKNITAAPTLKTITITNTSNQTIYPILRDANTGQDPHNTNQNNPKNYYDPQDFHNQEYRAYIGYVEDGVQHLGL